MTWRSRLLCAAFVAPETAEAKLDPAKLPLDDDVIRMPDASLGTTTNPGICDSPYPAGAALFGSLLMVGGAVCPIAVLCRGSLSAGLTQEWDDIDGADEEDESLFQWSQELQQAPDFDGL